jgi:type IX secretion system substrate protein
MMKKLLTITLLSLTLLHYELSAQITNDVVSIGQGYSNQAFYSMQNGEISNIDNTDWDLAFQISGFQAAIIVNSKNDVRLFKSGFHANDWGLLTPSDTINVLNASNELYNSDTSWWSGAFNVTFDPNNPFDLGWGVYDFATHIVSGDSIYFMILPNGAVKKVWIESLANAVYTFRHANLDGTNEVTATLDKMNYTARNFGYYSVTNNLVIDREPNKYDWDLVFHQYVAITPFIYKVTGVESNDSVNVAKAYPVDYALADPWGFPYSHYINTIGNDWKAFDLNSFSWVLVDSTVYFVQDRNGQIWKMQFTSFGGSSTGDFEFTKEPVSATGINENDSPSIIGLYPNPASNYVRIVTDKVTPDASLSIYAITGEQMLTLPIAGNGELKEFDIDVSELAAGLYVINVQSSAGSVFIKLTIAK